MTRTTRVPAGTPVRVPTPPAGQAVPASGDTQTGNLTQDSTAVTGLPVDVRAIGWLPGMVVTGEGLMENTLIAAIDDTGCALTLSNPAAVTGNKELTTYPLAPWTPIGPAVTGSNQVKGNPRITGRFRALAVSEDGLRVYAGSALGGLWYSENCGVTWKALDHFSSTADSAGKLHFADALTVGALAVQWGVNSVQPGVPDPARDVVFVGSGEYPVFGLWANSLSMGQGIRVATGPSTDASSDAVNWQLEAADLTGMVVNRLAPDRVTTTTIWAATSLGLYQRQVNGVNVTWRKVDPGLGGGEIADVVVVAGMAGEQERIYAATPDGRLSRSVDGGPWQVVNLPAYPTRPYNAAPVAGSVRQDRVMQRVHLAGGNVPGVVVIYVLAEGPRLWRVENDAAHKVYGLPEDIFDDMGQPPSGLCLAVHPLTDATHQNLIAVGGEAYIGPDGRKQAALFRGQLTQNASGDWDFPPNSWTGEGIPAGIHALVWVPVPTAAPQLWAAGDFGIFKSPGDGQPFRAQNNGLLAVDSLALAQSPDGRVMLLGTLQGVLEQVSGETWKLALPGRIVGVAVDPGSPFRLYAQVLGEGWKVLDRAETNSGWQELKFQGGPPPTVATGTPQETIWKKAKEDETDQIAAASHLALIANPNCLRGTQIALGTNRIWYSDNVTKAAKSGSSQGWVTLPSGSDPFGGAAPDVKQDALDSPVRSACWASADVLYVLTAGCLYRFERQVDYKTGNTHSSITIDSLSENVWESGWQPGLPIRGSGIPSNATIAAIAVDGRSLTLTKAANTSINGVDLSVPVCGDTRTGNVQANDRLISNISADVHAAGWKVGMTISGAQIPPETTIVSIEPDNRAVRISNPATAAANRMIVSVPAASVWTQNIVYDKETVRHSLKFKIIGGALPPDLKLTCIAPHDLERGTGSLYVGTAGNPDDEHLWWFDGVNTWRATGLRDQLADSPIFAVVVDPADHNIVYVGTEHGVWQGRGYFPANGGRPSWNWFYFATGLPEAACMDLAITVPANPAQRVLRAALAGLGVWEARLNLPEAIPPALYLRADAFDQRLETILAGGGRDPSFAQGRQLRLDASPDLRVFRRPAQLRDDIKTGNTHSNTTVDGLAANVRLAGWRVGTPISGAGIPPGTRIASIAANGLSITLSNSATATANGVALSVPVLGNTQPGNLQQNNVTVQNLPVDVRRQGWQAGMMVVGEHIPPLSTIVSIAANGLSVNLSLPAEATQAGTPLTVLPAVPGMQALPNANTTDAYDIWLLQSGLRLDGADLTPDGVWSAATRAALDARRVALGRPVRPVPAADAAEWDETLWQGVVLGNRLPYEHANPDHADLALHAWGEPDRWPKGRRAASAASPLATVKVTVHSRVPQPANSVRVVLLKTAYAGSADLLGVADLPVNWANNLQIDINQAVPNGTWLGVNWFYADPANPARIIPAALDTHTPQVVSFDLELGVQTRIGNITNNSVTISNLSSNVLADGWQTGMQITGNGLQADTTITAIANNGLSLTLSKPATATTAGRQLTTIGTTVFDKPGWLLLAVVYSANDPLATNETHIATLVRTDRHVAARSVRNARVLPSEPAWAGMDISQYLERATMDTAWKLSNIYWTGLYLDSPRPEPALGDPGGGGHNRGGNPPGDWMHAWNELHSDWGILVIYWGQQGAGARAGPYLGATRADAIARANAADAISKAYFAGISPGAVIYLDYEDAAAANANAIAYCKVFFRVIAEFGFRPGIYGRGSTVPAGQPAVTRQLRDVIPGIMAWNVRYRPWPPPATAWRLWRGHIILDTTQPVGLDDPQAFMRQWAQSNPPTSPLPALRDENGVVQPNPVAPNFLIDLDLGFLHDPAFPERRSLGNCINGGRAAALSLGNGECAVHAVRCGQLKRNTWPAPGVPPETVSKDTTYGWNPFAPMAALSLPGTADEMLIGLGYQRAEGEDIWRIQALRRLGKIPWQHQTVPSAGVRIDPLAGVTACGRSGGSVQAITVDDVTGSLAGAFFSPQQGWLPLSRLVDTGGAPVTPAVTRTNRPAVVSRDIGLADVFWVQPAFDPLNVAGATNATPILITTNAPHNLANGAPVIIYGVSGNTAANGTFTITPASATTFTLNGSTGNGNYNGGGTVIPIDQRLYTSASTAANPNHWGAAARIGPDNVRTHPLANLVAVSARPGRMDVLFVGRADSATAWSLYDYYWETADGWGNPPHVAHLDIIILPAADSVAPPSAVEFDPLVSIAACSLNANRIDVYLAGMDGALYTTYFDPTGAPAFDSFRPIGGALPAHIISVDAAVAQGSSQLSVFVTCSDGLLYGLSSTGLITTAQTNYNNLAQVVI